MLQLLLTPCTCALITGITIYHDEVLVLRLATVMKTMLTMLMMVIK